MSNLAKQSELLFIWDAKMCNPNGDMSADNAPRFDDVDGKAIVSDVRIKRTIRDDLQYRKNELIFINNEEILAGYTNYKNELESVTGANRFLQIKSKFLNNEIVNKIKNNYEEKLKEKKGNERKNIESERNEKIDRAIFLQCIDNRLFGGVKPQSGGSGIQIVGTVQFSWTKSLNKTETVLKSGTGAFATKGKDGETKFKKTFRVDNYIPYGVFGMYGTVNRMQAQKANTSENDVLTMLDSLWMGTKFLNTRSKEGQKPRMMLRVVYKEDSQFFIGLIDELVTLKNRDSSMIRNINDVEFDFSSLIKSLNKAKDEIDSVKIVLDDSMDKYRSELNEINNVKFVNETIIMG